MEQQQKALYVTPAVETLELKTEGVICESGNLGVTRTDNYGDAIQEVW